MKASVSCAPCIVRRSLQKVCLATSDEAMRVEFMRRALLYLSEWLSEGSVPSFYTIRENKILFEVTGNNDPYADKKRKVIAHARKCLPHFRTFVTGGRSAKDRLMRALKVSICGNRIEVSAPQHKVDITSLEREIKGCMRRGLAVDDTEMIFRAVKSSRTIAFICDNCGEAVLDTLFLNELKAYAEVFIAVSTDPIEDDVSLKEAAAIGLDRYGTVVGRGGAAQGVNREENSDEFWGLLGKADLIIAKGMSCYETLTEYPEISGGKTAFLFTVKCNTVSQSIGRDLGGNIAWFVKGGRR